MYPLIITTINKDEIEIMFEGETGSIMRLKNSYKEVAELVGDISNCSDPLTLCDMKSNKITSDYNINVVKVGQTYKDEKNLIFVLARYFIEHSFNFKAQRSDKKWYLSRFNFQK